jgi:putative hydrolase of the HAD superfamily
MRAPVWLFDLDNTLHNASAHVFPHINAAMTTYIRTHLAVDEDEANRLRMHYWQRYGATLLGLVRHHGTDPAHFLAQTHPYEQLHDMLVFDRALRHRLRHLHGRKIVFSNGPAAYARRVLSLMGVERCFDDVFAVEHMALQPKPHTGAFRRLLRAHRLHPGRCILVEDSLENLHTAKRLGMRTVWIARQAGRPAYVDIKLPSVLQLPDVISRLGFRR